MIVIPLRAASASIVDCPLWVVKPESQPPDSVRALSIRTTSVPLPVYVPIATSIVSPAAALAMAPWILAHGASTVEQEFASAPVSETYQVAGPTLCAAT